MRRAFVVSDLHLGGEPGFQMCPARNRSALAALLTSFGRHRSADVDVHVVLAGDVVDFLAESPYERFTAVATSAKLGRIFERSGEVWDALASLVRDGCELTVMLGNHDIELALPDARAQLLQRLGPGRVRLHTDGSPIRLGSTIVAHGNADDEWNQVDYRRLNQLASGEMVDLDEVAVPGSELVTSVMNIVKRDHPWVDLLKPETSAVLPLLAVLQPSIVNHLPRVAHLYAKAKWRTAIRRGDMDGIAATSSVADHLELARELAGASDEIGARGPLAALQDLWRLAIDAMRDAVRSRMRRALGAFAPVHHFYTERDDAMETMAESMLRDHGATTVIFGHTHLAKRVKVNGGMYLNTGTWADLMSLPPETWLAELTGPEQATFDQFIDDLVNNRLDARRKLVATYACVDHGDDASAAELWFSEGARVSAGDLLRFAP